MNRNPPIHSSSVILVSGGGRGITAQCVIKLAQYYPCNFILLGRSPFTETEPEWAKNCRNEADLKKRIMQDLIAQGEKPTPIKVQKIFKTLSAQREIATTLSTIHQVGGQAEYLSVDITNYAALQTGLASVVQRLGTITGMIHGAGNLADKLIENKSEQDFDTVYAAKVEGLENLLNCVPPSQLDFLVLFSSFVAFYGNAGQADYALANEILNKTAYRLQHQYPTCHVVSIGWGPWDGGMVTPQLKKVFTQLNIELIPESVGAQILADELHDSYANTAQILVMSNPIVPSLQPLNPDLQTFRIRRQLTLTANPFLYHHVIDGKPVLPAMCGLAWMANTCEQLYPGYQFLSCQNYKVLKGIVFDDTLAQDYILDVKEINKSKSGEIEFEGLLWSESRNGIPHYHYSAQIKLVQQIPLADTETPLMIRQDSVRLRLFPYQDGTLFHQPYFQGLKGMLKISPDHLMAHCRFEAIQVRKQGQFPVQTFNPYTADALFQSLLVWVRHYYDAGSLPLQVQRLEQFKAIPFEQDFYVSLTVHSSRENQAIASATASDSRGQVYLRISQMQVTVSPRLNPLFLQNTC
ncbi:MAG: SDR family NAD(P)-dependent oxidoreductase [Coleofasciculus sp. C1-SOL-03]|uniref:SDR family NAD(P)-dependent oxidoreductase n=1 Tax=Coleofasciculus sp. C1-SOL-03 TaxID=3069522 RepID=UPI0032F0BA50